MPVVRERPLGTIELSGQGNFPFAMSSPDGDATLAGLFQRLAHQHTTCVFHHSQRQDPASRIEYSGSGDLEFAPADLVELEVELSQELSLVLARMQRATSGEV